MILIKFDALNLEIEKLIDINKIGIMYLLSCEGKTKYVSLEAFCQKYNVEVASIKETINLAKSMNLVDIKTETNDSDTVIFIKNKEVPEKEINIVKISLFFGLDIVQIKNCYDSSNGDAQFFKSLIFNLAKAKSETTQPPNVTFNSKEDVIKFLSNSNVFEVISSRGTVLSSKDINFLIDLTESPLPIPVLNCLVDFCIKSNEYSNLNPNFGSKVHLTWKNSNVDSISNAIELINTQKAQINKKENIYVEPTYQKYEEEKQPENVNIEDIINNVF